MKKRVLYTTFFLSSLLLAYGYHFYSIPFDIFSTFDIFSIVLGVLIISFSLVKNPFSFLEILGVYIFNDPSLSPLKSIFVGLLQYLTLQIIGWHLIVRVSLIEVIKFSDFIDGATIVQTAGTIASLIFAAFQMVTASAESQYEVKGRLRFDKNDELYFYLRLTLSAAIGAFIGQNTGAMTKAVPFAQAVLILSLLFLIPLISIIFKSFTPDAILRKGKNQVSSCIGELFANLNSSGKYRMIKTKIKFKVVCDSLTQVSIVASWAFRHKVIVPFELIKEPFTDAFNNFFKFLSNLESEQNRPIFPKDSFLEELAIRRLEAIDLSNSEMENFNFPPSDILERKKNEFLNSIDLPLKIISSFFLPFRTMIISSLASNGINYANLQDILIEFIKRASEIKSQEWRRGIFLMMLGDFTDGILTLPIEHNATKEIYHLWFLLLKAKTELKLDGDDSISSQFDYCREQFFVIGSNN